MAISPNKIRVCAFSYYFPPHFSGAGLYAISLAKALSKKGVEFFFVTVDNSGLAQHDLHQGFDVYRIADGPRKHGELVLWWNMWRALRAHRDRFDIVHALGSTYRNSAVGLISKVLGKKSLTTVSMAHNDLYQIGRSAAGAVQKFLLSYVDRYVSLSRQISAEIRELPLDHSKAVEIPQGVDTDRFRPAVAAEKLVLRRRLGIPEEGPLALFVGVFDSRKNVEWLVKAWAKHRAKFSDWRLLLVGPTSRDLRDAGLRASLRDFVRQAGLEQIVLFHDFSPQAEDYYRAADAFLLPSQNEGMPNVVLEAMACGLACVVTRISGTTDLILHGQTGMLFDVDDEGVFAAAMSQLASDKELVYSIGEHAAVLIRQQYSVQTIADKYLQLYRNMLGDR
jgi:glycosyltransferase involved in cell wall biosynthesis